MKTIRHYEFPADADMDADEAIWFANARRVALDAAEQESQRSRRIDRLVNWGFTALIVGFGLWAVFA